MVVPTMTEEELKAEVLADMANAFAFSDRVDNKFRRLVIKSSVFPVYKHFVYRSPRKNKWLILYEAHNKKEFGDRSRITFICTWDTNHGIYAAMFTTTNNKAHLIIYPPHFFTRYAERFGVDLTGRELMVEYFRHNGSYVYDLKRKMLSEDTYTEECYGSSEDGVALGYITTESNILFKTFVTYDMLKGEQIEKFTNNEELRKEIHESWFQ